MVAERCFKVVTTSHGVYMSAFVRHEAQVVYEIGKPTRAPGYMLKHGYGLLGFSNQADAINFMRESYGDCLFLALGTDPMPLPLRLLTPEFVWGWNRVKGRIPFVRKAWVWPPGTVMYRQIELTQLLHRNVV